MLIIRRYYSDVIEDYVEKPINTALSAPVVSTVVPKRKARTINSVISAIKGIKIGLVGQKKKQDIGSL